MADTKISELPAASAMSDTDNIPVSQGSTTGKRTWLLMRQDLRDTERWFPLVSSIWTATPASTSSITVSSTTGVLPGSAIRYAIGGTYYYGIIESIVTDTTINVRGAPLSGTITALELGGPGTLSQWDIVITGDYAETTTTTLIEDALSAFRWQQRAARIVDFQAIQISATGTKNAKINVLVEGNRVSSNDSTAGITMSAAGTWVRNSAVAINTTNYVVAKGDDIELEVTTVSGSGTLSSLTVSLVFVLI